MAEQLKPVSSDISCTVRPGRASRAFKIFVLVARPGLTLRLRER